MDTLKINEGVMKLAETQAAAAGYGEDVGRWLDNLIMDSACDFRPDHCGDLDPEGEGGCARAPGEDCVFLHIPEVINLA